VRASASSNVVVRIKLKRGTKFRGFVRRQVATNIVGRSGRPPFCGALPKSFSHVARKPLHGTLISGYDARTTARYAYLAGCRSFAERDAFLLAIRGGSGSGGGDGQGGGGGGGGGGSGAAPDCDIDDPECTGDGEEGPTVSNTLQGSGTVTRDPGDPSLFTYTISFNEAVTGYRIHLWAPRSRAASRSPRVPSRPRR
jgi:hypothetical protein